MSNVDVKKSEEEECMKSDNYSPYQKVMEEKKELYIGQPIYAVSFVDDKYDERCKQHPIFVFSEMEIILIKDDYIYLEIPDVNDKDYTNYVFHRNLYNNQIYKIERSSIFTKFSDIVEHDKTVFKYDKCWKHLQFCIVNPFDDFNTEGFNYLGEIIKEYALDRYYKAIDVCDTKIVELGEQISQMVNKKESIKKKFDLLMEYSKDVSGEIMSKNGKFDPLFYKHFKNE